MRAVGIHTFAGGFALGLSLNLDILAQYELPGEPMRGPRASEHRQAIADARHNHPWEINECSPDEIRNIGGIHHDVNVVFGNAPCAPWSTMNTANSNWRDDPRLSMTMDIIEAGINADSEIIMAESVVRSWTSGKTFWINQARRLVKLGYSVYFWLHNVNALGGFQKRNRFMFIASKLKLDFPEPIAERFRPKLRDHIALMEDLEQTVTYSPKAANPELFEFWQNAEPGPLRKQVNGHSIPAPPFIARKLGLDLPVPTIVGRYVVHPTEPRCLHWGEFRHLLGFPGTWETTRPQVKSGDVEAGILPMTRGVCPTVGYHLSQIIDDAYEMVDTPELLLIDQR